jgi:ATP-dependent helicase/nuclease subunit A
VLVDWPGQDKVPQRFVFLASEKKLPLSVQPMLETERQERLREELNALYVAMTRAKYQLVMSSVVPQSSAPSSWWQRLQAGCDKVEVASTDSSVAKPDNALVPLRVLPERTTSTAPAVLASLPATLASRIGQAMHRLLEWAPLGAKSVPAKDVQRVAPVFDLDAAQAGQAAQMANSILCGQAAWAWEAQEVVWHGNEVTVVIDGQVRRIDRLVQRSSGEWWVLDYKSASEPQSQVTLVTQLRSYQQAVQAIYPQQTVRAAFLSAQGALQELDPMS